MALQHIYSLWAIKITEYNLRQEKSTFNQILIGLIVTVLGGIILFFIQYSYFEKEETDEVVNLSDKIIGKWELSYQVDNYYGEFTKSNSITKYDTYYSNGTFIITNDDGKEFSGKYTINEENSTITKIFDHNFVAWNNVILYISDENMTITFENVEMPNNDELTTFKFTYKCV